MTLIEQIKAVFPSIDANHLFDLLLHKTYDDLLTYLHDPQRAETGQSFFSAAPTSVARKPTSQPIWSIQRCAKITAHNHDGASQLRPFPPMPSVGSLTLHWKSSMKKCIDASPLIVLLDERREYVIIGSHAGLVNAYEIDDGRLVWSWQAKDRIEGSAALSRDGQHVLVGRRLLRMSMWYCLYSGDYSGTLYALECTSGTLFSTYECQGLIKTIPCVHSAVDIVYLGAHDHFIHAVHLQVGFSAKMLLSVPEVAVRRRALRSAFGSSH